MQASSMSVSYTVIWQVLVLAASQMFAHVTGIGQAAEEQPAAHKYMKGGRAWEETHTYLCTLGSL